MQISKPGLPTTEILGMMSPSIADLGGGWHLVAEPHGVAIATKTRMFELQTTSTEVPESIRAKAVEEFEEFAWPKIRGHFYAEPEAAIARAEKLTLRDEVQVGAGTTLPTGKCHCCKHWLSGEAKCEVDGPSPTPKGFNSCDSWRGTTDG